MKGHEPCNHRKEKDAVAEPPKRLIIETLGPLLLTEENPIEEIDRHTHGTEPSTEEITQDQNKKEDPKGREHPQDEALLGQDSDDSDERVKSKVEINSDLQFQGEGRLDDQIEKETEGEGLNRPP